MKRVFICSRFRGDYEQNIEVAKRFLRFAINQGVAPYAPHLLYPQCLDDTNPIEREIGISSGIAFLDACDELWFIDYPSGPSEGMQKEIEWAVQKGIRIRCFHRYLDDFRELHPIEKDIE